MCELLIDRLCYYGVVRQKKKNYKKKTICWPHEHTRLNSYIYATPHDQLQIYQIIVHIRSSMI